MNNTIGYYNDTMDVMTGSYILVASWIFCFVIVGCVHKDTRVVSSSQEETNYAEKYYEMYKEIPLSELEETRVKSLSGEYIKEETDKGTVIMCYNSSTSAFHFWSDVNIPYTSLDAAAQLYSIVHKCKSICVDYKEEYEKASEKHTTDTDTDMDKTNLPKKLDGPFATFKSYNTIKPTSKNKTVIIPENCNHFRKCGTLNVWDSQEQIKSPGSWSPSFISDTAMKWCKQIMDTSTVSHREPLTYSAWMTSKYKKV